MKLTARGAALLAAALTLLVTALAQPLLAPAAIMILAYLLYEALSILKAGEELALEAPGEIELVLGEEAVETLELRAPKPLLILELELLPDRPGLEARGEAALCPGRVEVRLGSSLSGIYVIEEARVVYALPQALVIQEARLPIRLTVRVHPKTRLLVARLIGAAGPGPQAYEAPEPRAVDRVGWEYYGSREALPGEPVKYVDWKATARLNRLMVKEFLREAGGRVLVLLDATARVSELELDDMCSTAVLVVNACRRRGLPAALGLWRAGRVEEVTPYASSPPEYFQLYLKVLELYSSRLVTSPDDYEVCSLEVRAAATPLHHMAKLARSRLRAAPPPRSLIVVVSTLRSPIEQVAMLRRLEQGVRILYLVPRPYWACMGELARPVAREQFARKVASLRVLGARVVVARPEELARIPVEVGEL